MSVDGRRSMRSVGVYVAATALLLASCVTRGTPQAGPAVTEPGQLTPGPLASTQQGSEPSSSPPIEVTSKDPVTTLGPATPGRYLFAVARVLRLGELPTTREDEGEDVLVAAPADGSRQLLTAEGFSHGNTMVELHVEWRRRWGSVFERNLRIERQDGTWSDNRCRYEPPHKAWPSGSGRGPWATGYDCPGSARHEYEGRVLRRETIRIDGATVRTIVVRVTRTEFIGGDMTRMVERTEWFAPEPALVVRWHEKDFASGADEPRVVLRAIIKSLTPEPG